MPRHNFDRPRGSLVEITIDSDALRGNLLGDPSVRAVAVYLPPGYHQSDRHYPVMVDLAAFTGSGLKRLAWTAFGENVPQRLDRLVAEGRMGPVIAVFPDAFTSLGGNQYLDSLVLGHWDRFLTAELLPRIDAEFRTLPGKSHRAVYGKSSGGYGALVQGMRHAEHWSAIACQSGDMGFEWAYLRDLPGALDTLARHGGSVERYLQDVAEAPKARGEHFQTLMVLALAASYDPDPKAPLGIRLPVDLHTCELDADRWARWLEHDPVRMVDDPSCQENLRKLSALFIDCGRRDQYYLHYGARTLVRKLERLGIAHHYEEFDDNHSSIDYRLDASLPFLYQAIAGE